MGYTTAAARKFLGPHAHVVVAELVPAIVTWNQLPLAHLAGNPLGDPRVQMLVQDVAQILKGTASVFDAILLNVDNGPQSMTRRGNAWLYSVAGSKSARATLRPQGVLAVWSATPDAGFSQALRYAGFQVTEAPVRARGKQGGSHHLIWLAVARTKVLHPFFEKE
jgi:spermidine synthase